MNIKHGFIILTLSVFKINAKFEERYRMPFMEVAALDGYYAEEHEVTSEDGYILVHHRIPFSRNSTIPNKPPIFILPGLSATSDGFIMMGQNYSVGYVLADHGFDVWILNPRGNKYSNRHVKYKSNTDKEYWDFSLHETGYYDIPASVDYILNVTGAKKIAGIGHSQGSASLFLGLASRPEYNDKFNLVIHFGPSAYLNESQLQPIYFIGQHWKFIDFMLRDVLNIHHIPDAQGFFNGLEFLCSASPAFKYFCSMVVNLIDFGADSNTAYDKDIYPLILSHMPSGLCVKLAIHYFQLVKSGLFRNFDHGLVENLRRYGSDFPPTYDLKKISVPTALFYSPLDLLLPMNGIKRLIKDLQKPIICELKHKDFRHITYLISKIVRVIYPDLFRILNKYSL